MTSVVAVGPLRLREDPRRNGRHRAEDCRMVRPRLNGVQRTIIDYYQDDDDDWVAELSCGHNQHVRHNPPWQERPWIVNAAGRADRVGKPLECPLCDRAELPGNLRLVRTSREWNEQSMPRGLSRSHRLSAGTWGRIDVRAGCLQFWLDTQPSVTIELGPGARQPIPPEMDHEVRPLGSVRFSLDFLVIDRVHGKNPGSSVDQGGDLACWAGLVCDQCGIVRDGSDHRPGCSEARLA